MESRIEMRPRGVSVLYEIEILEARRIAALAAAAREGFGPSSCASARGRAG
jgi:hypothetical protein